MIRILFSTLILFLSFHTCFSQKENLSVNDPKLTWWRDARFGLFIHWGPIMLTGAGGDGNLLLNVGPNSLGEFQADLVDRLAIELNPIYPASVSGSLAYVKPAKVSSSVAHLFKHTAQAAIDDNQDTYWSPGRNDSTSRAFIQELTRGDYPPVTSFRIDYEEKGIWKTAIKGTSIGKALDVNLPKPIKAQKFRLSIVAGGRPAIAEFQLFDIPKNI
jgi:hypothetical protein